MAGPRVSFNGSVQLRGFKEARAKLKQSPPFYAPAMRNFMDQLGKIGRTAAQAAAPKGATGQAASSNIYAVQDKPFPTWVRVKNTARAKGRLSKRQSKKARAGLAPLKYTKGVSYPAVLNFGVKGKKKSRWIGWFSNAMRTTRARIPSLLAGMGDQIEKEWAA
jgi:hypothetical protein